eukprot:TRINITY_DN2336_c0_g1_i2.p1 TRINITY_DN2336_c0_g1~~TRINITY_DN2336_c0_g1_i2.p1  ORF type:complete len:217 (+),score=53.72 TRINITY_DN2336_c0_g1_i2:67-717(+)
MCIRDRCKPVVNYTKKYHIDRTKGGSKMKDFFVWLGNYNYRLESKINRKFLRLSDTDDVYIKPLNEDVAIERGVEFFYELLVYGLMISLPLYEMYKGQVESQNKSDQLNARLEKIEGDITGVQERANVIAGDILRKVQTLEDMLGKIALPAPLGEEVGKLQRDIVLQVERDRLEREKLEQDIEALRREISARAGNPHQITSSMLNPLPDRPTTEST